MSKISILIFIVIIGATLRLVWLNSAPISLSVDEVSYGYNAFSLLHSGRDQYQRSLPIIFEALGDYKLPVNMYLTIPTIALFGTSEIAIRLPTAFISTLTLLVLYAFIFQLTRRSTFALICTFVFAISPWHLRFSRGAYESSIALFFLLLSTLYFLKNKTRSTYIFFLLSLMTYNSLRLFAPLFFISLSLIYSRKKLALGFVALTLIPLIIGHSTSRASQILVTQDPLIHQVLLNFSKPYTFLQPVLLFWSVTNRYLEYFDPSFLFSHGLGLTLSPLFDHGVLYFIELPLLLGGLYLTRKKPCSLIILWSILSPLPASLTLNDYHPIRSLHMIIGFIFMIGLSLEWLFIKHRRIFKLFILAYAVSFIIFADLYFVHLPVQLSDQSFDPSRQIAKLAIIQSSNYDRIIIDPQFGKSAPNIIGTPDLYILYFGHISPEIYWNSHTSTGFQKYSFRHIEWYIDRNLPNTLLIGSPWSLPVSQIDLKHIIAQVNFRNGDPAYFAVSTYVP